MGIVAKITDRFDGWMNALSGLGVLGKDKRISASIAWERLTEDDCDNLYAGDDVIAKIVDQLPYDGTRAGWCWEDLNGKESEASKQMEAFEDKNSIKSLVNNAWQQARQYGGSVLLMIPSATADMSKPRGMNEQIKNIVVLNRYECVAGGLIISDLGSPKFGQPANYQVTTPVGGAQIAEVHHTRVIRFDGSKLPRRLFVRNNYWHDSVITKIYNAVRNYQVSHDSVASTIQDFNVGVWKLKDLAEMVSGGKMSTLKERVEIANYSKSAVKSILIDANMEEYEDKSRNVTGLFDLLKLVGDRLVTASNMPHTLILGESPTGSNATGNSTTMSWYDYVASQQKIYLEPKLIEIADFFGMVGIKPKFESLWQLDKVEEAKYRKTVAETDDIYVSMGALDPSEVAINRFSGEFNAETELMTLRVATAPKEQDPNLGQLPTPPVPQKT